VKQILVAAAGGSMSEIYSRNPIADFVAGKRSWTEAVA
jgi:hypothetical protein